MKHELHITDLTVSLFSWRLLILTGCLVWNITPSLSHTHWHKRRARRQQNALVITGKAHLTDPPPRAALCQRLYPSLDPENAPLFFFFHARTQSRLSGCTCAPRQLMRRFHGSNQLYLYPQRQIDFCAGLLSGDQERLSKEHLRSHGQTLSLIFQNLKRNY